jgi:hypothetical protein
MNNSKKIWILVLVLSLTLAAALSACMRSNNGPVAPEVTMAPEAFATGMPGATTQPDNPVVQDAFDWTARAGDVEKRVGMFSEIADSRVIAMDQTALVGVKFASQYRGEMTQRIREMIAGEVMAADPSIQVVAVTAEPGDVATIFNLAEQMKTGGAREEDVRAQVDRIVKNATTMK